MAKKKLSDSDFDRYFNDSSFRKKKKKSAGINKKILLPVGGVLAVLFIIFTVYIFSGLPSLEELENPRPQLASKVFTADGELLGQFFIENRIETNIDSLPKHLIDALIATEDRKFYSHWGVDLSRFFKAMIKNIFTFSREGASTITQQLARNLYELKIGRENIFDTGVRKIREWLTAIQIEKTYTKDEILELYFNVSYFGRSAYGIESAAQVYFGKTGKELTLPESALFIALLKSPEHYDPIRRNENSLRRRNLVMLNMVRTDILGQSVYEELREQPILLVSERPSAVRTEAPHFMEYVRLQLTGLSEMYGYDLYRDGLNIYTTLDLRMQRIANKAAAEHLKEYQAIFNKNWNWDRNKSLLASLIDRAIKNSPVYIAAGSAEEKAIVYNRLKDDQKFVDSVKTAETTIQVGFVVIDQSTGQIKALVGGASQEFGRGLNHVTGIKRQSGSAFKPIVYTVATDHGYYPAYTVLNQKFDYKGWSPSNANHEYSGFMTLRQALAFSTNVVAGRLTIGEIAPPSSVIRYAKRMGIQSNMSPYPSIALGTFELSPLELTSAFGTIGNNGVYVSPISVLKIEDRNGILIDQFVPEYREAISPETAAIVTNMMQDIVSYGTGAGVRRYFQYPAAGKTGTTQNFSDAWFVGFTPQIAAGVWVGFDDHRIKFTSWYGQGAKAALPIWAKFMEGAYKELKIPLKYFELPENVKSAQFCKATLDLGDARLATDNCPDRVSDIINEKNPPPYCDLHTGGRIKREDRRDGSGW